MESNENCKAPLEEQLNKSNKEKVEILQNELIQNIQSNEGLKNENVLNKKKVESLQNENVKLNEKFEKQLNELQQVVQKPVIPEPPVVKSSNTRVSPDIKKRIALLNESGIVSFGKKILSDLKYLSRCT